MQPTPLATILTGFSAMALLLSLALCAAGMVVRRLWPGARILPALRLALWCAAPTAVACVANLAMRLTRCPSNNPVTYPFFANPVVRPGTGFANAIKDVVSRPGIWPWAFVSLVALVVLALLSAASGRAAKRAWTTAVHLVVLVCTAFVLAVSVASMPDGFFNHPEAGRRSSFVSAWTCEGTTMLLAVPYMRLGSKRYMWEYRSLQRRLRQHRVIHAVSHPPLASLVVRSIGRRFGVRVKDKNSVHAFDQQVRYALGQSVVSSLLLLVVFAFGAAMFGRAAGLLCASLWAVSASFVAHASFAPDMNYAPCFVGALALTWKLSDEPSAGRAVLKWGVALGALYAVLCLMTYSWCIATTVTAVFAAADSLARGRGWRDAAARAILPMVAFAAFAAFLIVRYRVDYVANYLFSSEYVSGFYHHSRFLFKAVYFLGGQVEWLYMVGPATVSCFFLSLAPLRRDAWGAARLRFLAVLMGTVAIPFLFGPPCLKHEVARCWVWLSPVPAAFAAHWLKDRNSPALCAAVAAASGVVTVLLCTFCDFGA